MVKRELLPRLSPAGLILAPDRPKAGLLTAPDPVLARLESQLQPAPRRDPALR